MRHIQKSKQKEYRLYAKEAKQFIEENSFCEIKSPHCSLISSCVHHKKGRVGKLLRDQRFWTASCYACNGYVEENKSWAIERGFRLDRLGIQEGENDDSSRDLD